MLEAKAVLPRHERPVGKHEPLAHERHQVRPDRTARVRRRELVDDPAPELAPDDGRPLEHVVLVRVEPVEAPGEQCLE